MRCSFRCAALCLGALALGLVMSPARGLADIPKDAKAIELKDGKATVDGRIEENDPKDRVRNFPSKLFAIKLKANATYQIDLKSKDFDSYLRLDDADGKELAKDDDSGGFPDARIKFTPTKDGTYVISATTFGGGKGAFTLDVVQSGGGAGDGKELALQNGAASVEGKLDNNDPKDTARNGSFAKVYTIKLEGGKDYQIDMTSKAVDSYLRLEDATNKQLAADDDGGGFPDARITFSCPANGVYRIICTTFKGGETGEFSLRVQQK